MLQYEPKQTHEINIMVGNKHLFIDLRHASMIIFWFEFECIAFIHYLM